MPPFSTHSWLCYVWCLTGLRKLVDEGLPPHSPRHRAPSWGWAMHGWARMWACGRAQLGRANGWSELWGAGDQPCYSVTCGPGGLKWGPWDMGRVGRALGSGGGSKAYSCPQGPDTHKQMPQCRDSLLWGKMGTVGSGLNPQRPSCKKLHSLCSNIYVTKVRKIKM